MVAWVLLQHENEGQDKHVESVWFPRVDEGSIPSTSTKFLLYITDCQSVGDIFVLPFGGDFGGDWGAILLKGAIAIVCPSICDLRICL